MKQVLTIIILYVLAAAALAAAVILRVGAPEGQWMEVAVLGAAFGLLSLVASVLLMGRVRIRRRRTTLDFDGPFDGMG